MSLSSPRLCSSLQYRQQLVYELPHSAILLQATSFTSTCSMPFSRLSFIHRLLPSFFWYGVGNSAINRSNCFCGISLVTSYMGSHLLTVTTHFSFSNNLLSKYL